MKAEARSSLIYHGRSNPDPSFVEIAFDNSDRKLPVSFFYIVLYAFANKDYLQVSVGIFFT